MITVYIYECSEWPNFQWDSALLAMPLAQVRHNQGRHLGKMETLGFDLRAEANVAALTEEVVKSSAIEGERLASSVVRSSIARRLGLDAAGLPRPSRDVDGIVEMMLDATQNYTSPLTAERLIGWHAALFPSARSGTRRIAVGTWRTGVRGPMQVVSGPIGRETAHFEAPAAEHVAHEMGLFLEWCNTESDLDPVLRAAVAHFWFLTIHPFEDGNGRIARTIAELWLTRADGTENRFYSMSSAIEEKRGEYYRALESTQKGTLDITHWLLWFLGCLEHTLDNADRLLHSVLRKSKLWDRLRSRPINDRQRKVISRLLDDFQGPLSTSKYAKLAKCSTDSALRDIRELLEWGVLVKNEGRGRSTSYRLEDRV